MFKLTATFLSKVSAPSSITQYFSEIEKGLAIATAARLQSSNSYADVRLLAYDQSAGYVEFSWVEIKEQQQPKSYKAVVQEFDIPVQKRPVVQPSNKRISKRMCRFGNEANHRCID